MTIKDLKGIEKFYIKELYKHEQKNMGIDKLNSIVTTHKTYKVRDKHRKLYRKVKNDNPDLLKEVLEAGR